MRLKPLHRSHAWSYDIGKDRTHDGRPLRTPTVIDEFTPDRLAALGDVRAPVYAIALGTGLRAGEIRRRRWCDIDERRRVVHVPAASSKSRRDQSVPLAEVLLDQLAAAKPRAAKQTDPVIPLACSRSASRSTATAKPQASSARTRPAA